MTFLKLPFIQRYIDSRGKLRHYFRRPGIKLTALPGNPGSPEFMAAYHAAFEASENAVITPPVPKPPAPRGPEGSFDRLAYHYFQSAEFMALRASTRKAMRLRIERLLLAENIGHRSAAGMQRAHVKAMLSKRAATPGAANNDLKALRALLRIALDLGWRTDDPTLHIKKLREGTHHTWTDSEIERFESHWPVGTPQRTAFALALYSGQRRGDLCRVTWPQLEGGRLRLVQRKTGAPVMVPIHAGLAAALDAHPRRHVVVLTTHLGKPFTDAGFGNWFAAAIEQAGLPTRCVLHGLRKAAARRLAEAGCSALEIGSVTGHRTLSEVQRYTRDADNERLAESAMARLNGTLKTGKDQ